MTIDWAFAGTSSTTPTADEKIDHTVWSHWIDSTTLNAEEVDDEGDMIALDNGEVLERGKGVNSKTGKTETYEERWADIKPSGERVGWVVKAEDGQGTRGMVVRIGGFAQGLLRKGTEVGIKRWRYVEEEQGWSPIVEIGSCDVPADLFGEKSSAMEENDKFVGSDGLEWICVEKFVGDW
jgi:hypothetical protein